MILKAEVLSIEQRGDSVRFIAQAIADGQAAWRPFLKFDCEVPEHFGARFHVGDTLHIVLKREPRRRASR